MNAARLLVGAPAVGARQEGALVRIIMVCTGNLCRSPLGEQVLRAKLAHLPAASSGRLVIESAGTQAEAGQPMPEPAAMWSARLGGEPAGHGSRYLGEPVLQGASLVLGMEREHRARIVGLAPALLRRTFTLREFARLAAHFDDEALARAVEGPFVTADPESRLAAVLGLLSDARGMTPPPGDPAEDDVVDPYLRSEKTYALSAEQMQPGLDAVARVLSLPVLWQD